MLKFWINTILVIIISFPMLASSVNGADFQTWSDIATIFCWDHTK